MHLSESVMPWGMPSCHYEYLWELDPYYNIGINDIFKCCVIVLNYQLPVLNPQSPNTNVLVNISIYLTCKSKQIHGNVGYSINNKT